MYPMSAVTLPPNAGRVAVRSRPDMDSPVQSAVRPQCIDAATLGASSRPTGVAPNSMTAGLILAARAEMLSAHASGRYIARRGSLTW